MFFFPRGFAELELPVWQSNLLTAAVPSELPGWARPSQRRQKYVTGLFKVHVSRRPFCLFAKLLLFGEACRHCGWFKSKQIKDLKVCVRYFYRCGNGGLQSPSNQHHRDGSCLQVWILLKDISSYRSVFGIFTQTLIPVCVCVWSEMSRSEACLTQCAFQKATSGMQCSARWSLTWISTGRRRCCWEHMGRLEVFFTNSSLS